MDRSCRGTTRLQALLRSLVRWRLARHRAICRSLHRQQQVSPDAFIYFIIRSIPSFIRIPTHLLCLWCFLNTLFPCIPEGNYSQFSRTSFNLFISSGFAICPFMPVFLASCTSSAKALAVIATIGSFPFSPGRLLIAAVAS